MTAAHPGIVAGAWSAAASSYTHLACHRADLRIGSINGLVHSSSGAAEGLVDLASQLLRGAVHRLERTANSPCHASCRLVNCAFDMVKAVFDRGQRAVEGAANVACNIAGTLAEAAC
jgi:hypothetical protein